MQDRENRLLSDMEEKTIKQEDILNAQLRELVAREEAHGKGLIYIGRITIVAVITKRQPSKFLFFCEISWSKEHSLTQKYQNKKKTAV